MISASDGKDYCPDCGGTLLFNGQGQVCIRWPFAAAKPESNKDLPGVGMSAPHLEEGR